MQQPRSTMPSPREREEALFRAAVELSPGVARRAFLDQACGGDAALRQRLDALLVAHEEPDGSLATAAPAAKATIKIEFPDDQPDEAVGQTLGRYKLLECVGEGGCGVVYVAEQTEPVRRRVALKVIKLGMDTRHVGARFEAKRQALAMMDHPNIVKLPEAEGMTLSALAFLAASRLAVPMFRCLVVIVWTLCAAGIHAPAAETPASANAPSLGLRIATFDVDATPPIGSMMAYDPVTNHWELGLRARGIVLLDAGEPIVLCAVDWIGIANGGNDAFRQALAQAAGTTPQRVAVHALHQHDAPDCDFSAEQILKEAGMDPRQFDSGFQRQLLARLAGALREALPQAQPVSHLGLGAAPVEKVASNRRILGPDGKVRDTRWTATTDPKVRAEPEGVIDPMVSLVSFWNGEQPVAVLSYYATHPQSYYRTGIPNPDFPGLARFMRQLAVPSALHVHFDGAGGNIGAGKYNDGSPTNRLVLAERVADGMRRAWENTKRQPINSGDVSWGVEPVALPPCKHLSVEKLEAQLAARDKDFNASRLAWLRRCRDGHKIEVSCLSLGTARVLHLPGELFVEYQLAAKAVRPDLFVAMAAYGDYAPWYIGTAVAYEQGGYETSPSASNVAPEVENVLMAAIRKLLQVPK